MRIAVVHLGRTAAGPLFALQLARALRRDGHFVGVIYSANAEIANQLDEAGDASLPVKTFTSAISAAAGAVRLPIIRRRVSNFLKAMNIDVVIVAMEQIWQPFLSSAFSMEKRHVVLAVHDGMIHPGEDSAIARWLRGVERRNANAALIFSDHVKEVLLSSKQFTADQIISSIHPAFETDLHYSAREISTEKIPILGFFGRMSRYKGLQLAVDTVAELRTRGRRVRFQICGANVPEETQGLRHEDTLIDSRWIPQTEVEGVLDKFDIMLLSYTEASQSGVLGYAMALGIPSVVTPIGGLTQQATETGSAIVARDVSATALADSIELLLDDPALYKEISSTALASTQQNYSWQRVARDVVGGIELTREQRS